MFNRSIFPGRTGWSGSGGTGAEAQWLFLPLAGYTHDTISYGCKDGHAWDVRRSDES
jgi:hypothetical protein